MLANEFIGTELMAAVGLPVPLWRAAKISEIVTPHGEQTQYTLRAHSKCGLHFASRFQTANYGCRAYYRLPREYVQRIANRTDFIGAFVFDLWANSTDAREAIFMEQEDGTFRASFIDHGHLFGGPSWQFDHGTRNILHPEFIVYASQSRPELIQFWVQRIHELVNSVLSSVLLKVPAGWHSGDIVHLEHILRARQASLKMIVKGGLGAIEGQGRVIYRPVRDTSFAFTGIAAECSGEAIGPE